MWACAKAGRLLQLLQPGESGQSLFLESPQTGIQCPLSKRKTGRNGKNGKTVRVEHRCLLIEYYRTALPIGAPSGGKGGSGGGGVQILFTLQIPFTTRSHGGAQILKWTALTLPIAKTDPNTPPHHPFFFSFFFPGGENPCPGFPLFGASLRVRLAKIKAQAPREFHNFI